MLAVRVLGELELVLDGKRVALPPRKSGRLLLGYLALHPGLHARGDLASAMWPDVLETSARTSLRSAIAAVRRALGRDADRFILRVGDTIGFARGDEGVSVDAARFDALLEAGDLEGALELSSGPLLQGLDAEWVRQARLEHLERVSELLGGLAAEAERSGSLAAAIRYSRRQVSLSPLAEPPNRELMRRLTAGGDRASALAVYSELAERFRRELHAVPSAETRRLAEEARSGPEADGETFVALPLPVTLSTAVREPFVNRLRELSALSSALEDASAGTQQRVLVVGEPAIGKSMLLANFAVDVVSSATILLGRCRRPASTAFEPFLEALRYYVSNAPEERLERALPAAASELTGLVPGIAERVIGAPLPPDLLEDGGRVSRAIVETLLALSQDQPVVLLIEDLHDADPPTLGLIRRLLAEPRPARLLLILTLRDTELARSPALQRLIREAHALPGTRYLALDALDASSVAELARSLDRNHLSEEELRLVHGRTGGNPMFMAELLRNSDPFVPSPLPARVLDLVSDELAHLSTDARAGLTVASVIGVEFDLRTVISVAEFTEARALDALDEAVVSRAVHELPGLAGRYEFRHELIRESIYRGLTATRRAYLHRRVAEALKERPIETGDRPWRMVVEHLRRARNLVPSAQLADDIAAAADAANAERTYADAAALYTEAVALLKNRPGDLERRCRLLNLLGHARRRAGQGEGVSVVFLEAGELAHQLGNPDLLTDAALGLCAVPFFAGDRPADPAATALLEHALQALPDSENATRGRLLARLACEYHYNPARAPLDALAQEAVALARRSRDLSALSAALDVGHLVFRGGRAATQRLELARELVDLARDLGETEALVPAFVHLTVDQAQLGELSALEANADVLARLAAELRQPAYTWWAHLWRATSAIIAGRLELGAERARRAFEAGRPGFGESAELELRAQLAWLRIEQDQLDELAVSLPALEGAFSLLPVWGSLKARILADVGRREEAASTVAEFTSKGMARLERDTNWLISASLLAETFTRTKDIPAAEQLRVLLEPCAGHWAVSARATVCFGPVAGSLALLSAVEGRDQQAQRYYDMARQQCRTAGATQAAKRLEREYDYALGRDT